MRRGTSWWQKLPYGSILGLAAALYIAVYLVGTIKHNYDLQKEISILQQQIANLQVDNQQLKYKIQYYNTDSYKEKEARARLGLQAPGEGVIILPRQNDTANIQHASPSKSKPKSNLRQWADFLFGKS